MDMVPMGTNIPWEAYNNEPLPYKRICAEIEGVLNEVNSQ